MNPTKTKTMILNHQMTIEPYPTSIAIVNGVKIENVEIFRYLGSDTSVQYNLTINWPG
jgi:hypothetical protein